MAFRFSCNLQSIRQLLNLAGEIEKIFLQNMDGAGAIAQMDVASVAKRDFLSFVFFPDSPPKKESPISRRALTG